MGPVALLVVIGDLGFSSSTGAQWATGSLILVFTLAYKCNVGPTCHAVVAETSSTRLRRKTAVLGQMTYNGFSLLNKKLLPFQVNSLAWNLGSKAALFWAGMSLICVIWCMFRLPESKGRSYAELNLLFENRVAAWKLSKIEVDAFRSESMRVARQSIESENRCG